MSHRGAGSIDFVPSSVSYHLSAHKSIFSLRGGQFAAGETSGAWCKFVTNPVPYGPKKANCPISGFTYDPTIHNMASRQARPPFAMLGCACSVEVGLTDWRKSSIFEGRLILGVPWAPTPYPEKVHVICKPLRKRMVEFRDNLAIGE